MKALKKSNIMKIIDILDSLYPDTSSELNYENPFQLLVATILAAQATDRKVNEVTAELFQKYKTPRDFMELTHEELEKEIKQIHLYPSKARYIRQTSRILAEDYNGEVPKSREQLMRLPGVGRKTANVILSYAFNIPSIAVDTHVFRVANRLGIVKAKNPQQTELEMEKIIPVGKWSKAHSSMVLHGRRVCDARNPKCEACSLKDYCEFFKRGDINEKEIKKTVKGKHKKGSGASFADISASRL